MSVGEVTLEDALARLGGAVSRYYDAVAARMGLGRADIDCLVILAVEGTVPAGRFAEMTGLTTGGVTGVLDRLEHAGLVVREADPADRRRVLVRIAPGQTERLSDVDALPKLLASVSDAPEALARFAGSGAAALDAAIISMRGGHAGAPTADRDGSIALPRGRRTEATLEIAGGTNRLDLKGGAIGDRLLVATIPGGASRLTLDGDRVKFAGRKLSFFGHGAAVFKLSDAVRWTVAIRGGANVLDADFSALGLTECSIAGGTTSGTLVLGQPVGTSRIEIRGGATAIVLRRPAGVPLRVRRRGGIGEVKFDGHTATSGSRIEVQSPDFARATERFDVAVRGGITRLAIE